MNYAWGSPNRVERLFKIPTSGLVAELWYGAHERGPSPIIREAGAESEAHDLRELLMQDAAALLGEKIFRRYGSEFPFLFKILSAEKGLSIQAHPSKEQAQAGFARENARGIDIRAANRNYRDNNHKPECLVAVEDFWALTAFRSPGAIAANLEPPSAPPPLLQKLLDILKGQQETEAEIETILFHPYERHAG